MIILLTVTFERLYVYIHIEICFSFTTLLEHVYIYFFLSISKMLFVFIFFLFLVKDMNFILNNTLIYVSLTLSWFWNLNSHLLTTAHFHHDGKTWLSTTSCPMKHWSIFLLPLIIHSFSRKSKKKTLLFAIFSWLIVLFLLKYLQ